MNKILLKYLLYNYLKTILKVILIFYCFGIILNLFEEIEFFKNSNASLIVPITLTALFIPNMIIKLFPFIIFISSLAFLLNLRNNKDLLTFKIFGYSNFKIFFMLASSSFFLGWLLLVCFTPVTSSLLKYYEQTKAEYSRDIDYLVTINKNGLWIKENLSSGYRIISADKTRNSLLENVMIYDLHSDYSLVKKITSKKANITTNNWLFEDVIITTINENGLVKETFSKNYTIKSKYDYANIRSLFRNFDTMSFLDLVLNYDVLQSRGYSKITLDHNLNTKLSLPFFLFIMTALASILTLHTLKKSNNFSFIVAGIIGCVSIYYFKDLSLALGQTDRVSLSLSVWIPVITIGLFSSIGILQINEK